MRPEPCTPGCRWGIEMIICLTVSAGEPAVPQVHWHQEGDPAVEISEYSEAEHDEKVFTPAEARALLPEICALIDRFNQARTGASAAAATLEGIESSRTAGNAAAVGRPLRLAREELGLQVEGMRDVVRFLHRMGVRITHLDPALLDFPSRMNGHMVYLCWQEGEATIAFWHDIAAGFAGRRPLP
jgi:hypothetical protein